MDTSKTGERIREMRLKQPGLTQDKLAELLIGIPTARGGQTISEYENGKNIPPLEKIQQLAQILKCDAEYLLGCQDHPDATTSWIAEQIPLNRDAISKLIQLNNALDTNDPTFKKSFSMITGIINALIIELIPKRISPYEFGDSTGRKGHLLFNYSYSYLKAAQYLKAHGISLDDNHVTTIYDQIRKSKMRGTTEAIEVENAQLSMDANAIKIGNVLGDITIEHLKSLKEEA